MVTNKSKNDLSFGNFCTNLAANEFHFEESEGRKFMVVPVVMMVEGVHVNNSGPSLYLLEEFSINAESWDGMPVSIGHPCDESGEPISCNTSDVYESMVVGTIFNSRVEGGKQKAEIWIEVDKAEKVEPSLIPMIQNGEDIDVSTGHMSADEYVVGEWNGEKYDHIIRNIIPDHLALLPGAQGACGWADGCGIRANRKKEGGKQMKKIMTLEDARKVGEEIAKSDFTKSEWVANRLTSLVSFFGLNSLSYSEVHQALQRKVDQLDTMQKINFVVDVYDDYFIYEERSREGNAGESKMYKQGYSVGENNQINFDGDPVEVYRETEYLAVNEKSVEKLNKGEKQMKKKREEKVDTLIKNENSTFDESDRDFLLGLDDASFDNVSKIGDRFAEKHKAVVKENEELKKKTDEKPNGEENGEPKGNESPVTMEAYLKDAPPEIADTIKEGVELRNKKKAGLIQNILKNADGVFTEDELKEKKIPELEKLSTLAKPKGDYTGQAGAEEEEEISINERQADGTGVPPAPTMTDIANAGKAA